MIVLEYMDPIGLQSIRKLWANGGGALRWWSVGNALTQLYPVGVSNADNPLEDLRILNCLLGYENPHSWPIYKCLYILVL